MRGRTITFTVTDKRGKTSKTIPLYQYDYGQKLVFEGVELPEYYEVHFSNQMYGEAVTVLGDSTGVLIPDTLLATGEPVYVWLFLHDSSYDGETEYQGVIPIIKRAEPTDVTPTPEEQSIITEVIAALNNMEDDMSGQVEAAEAARDAAETAQAAAESAATTAGNASDAAGSAQTAAETAQAAAESAQTAAEAAQTAAEAAYTNADGARVAAVDAKAAAETAQTAAESASSTASSASGAATNAASSAETYKDDAKAAKNAAEAAQGLAEAAQTAAEAAEDNAEASALVAEGYATGKQNGDDVASGSTYYQNNAKYYAGEASDSATAAASSESDAESAASDSEAYAVGTRGGVDVSSDDPAYENNAKYYAESMIGKADLVSGAVEGNLAGLDSEGNLTDSGSKPSDFLTEHQDISGKLDAPSTAGTQGQVLTSDGEGGQAWADPSGAIDDTAGEGDTDVTWSADKLADEFGDVLTAIQGLDEEIYKDENLLNADYITYKTNSAITNNGDGTYTFGTGDYGSVFWESNDIVPAGKCVIPGSQYGYTVVSTSRSYTENVVATNNTGEDMEFTNPSDQHLYFCIRTDTHPASSFTFAPGIYQKASVINKDIKNYFVIEMKDTIDKARKENTEPALVFPWVTDIHRYKAPVQTFENMIQNIKRASEKICMDFLLNTGDTIEGDDQQNVSLGYAYDSVAALKEIGIPLMYVNGNHDNNPYISSGALVFNLKQVFGGFFTATKGVKCNINENGTDYYFDYENFGVRFIALNSCNSTKAINYGFGDSTAEWLEDALDTDNYVILASHVSPVSAHVWNNIDPANGTAIKNKLTSFVTNGGKLIILTGHSHVDAEFVSPFIEITNVCQKFEQADISTQQYQAISGMIDGIRNPARTTGTMTEDAWSIVVFKPYSKDIDIIRFGAGVDRHIHCQEIGVSTLTTKLTGTITWSSSNTSVATVANGVITKVSNGKCAIIAKDSSGNIEVWILNTQQQQDTTAQIEEYDKILWHGTGDNPYYTVSQTNGAVTVKYAMETPTTLLYPAGIIPTNGQVIRGSEACLFVCDANGDPFNYVNENTGIPPEYTRWAQDNTGTMTEFSSSWNLGQQYYYIQFTLDKRYLDDAYMYDKTSGQIWFAGVNTPYYGKTNVSDE